jgi:hypothetical protein
LSFTKNTTNFAGFGLACVPPNDVDVVRAFVEGLTRCQSHFLSACHLHHDRAFQHINKAICSVAMDGSELPGGYSTVIIRPSLPGNSVRFFDMSFVAFASCATSAPDMRHASAKITFVNIIKLAFRLTNAISMRRVYWSERCSYA